jgi:hypothetical protein
LTWSDEFEDPVPGLRTLREAAVYIQKLPKVEQKKPRWQTAVDMLIKAAEGSPGWMMFARMAMMRALNYGKPRVFSDRKETRWVKRKLKRDE